MPELFGAEFRLDPSRPIYLQLIERVKEALARGWLAPGDQLPAQRELAQRIGVNPNTVQRAYREMEHLGLVQPARGTGTFITLDPERVAALREELAAQAIDRCLQALRDLGLDEAEIARRLGQRLGTSIPHPESREGAP